MSSLTLHVCFNVPVKQLKCVLLKLKQNYKERSDIFVFPKKN